MVGGKGGSEDGQPQKGSQWKLSNPSLDDVKVQVWGGEEEEVVKKDYRPEKGAEGRHTQKK